jgi:hypothetical protein
MGKDDIPDPLSVPLPTDETLPPDETTTTTEAPPLPDILV